VSTAGHRSREWSRRALKFNLQLTKLDISSTLFKLSSQVRSSKRSCSRYRSVGIDLVCTSKALSSYTYTDLADFSASSMSLNDSLHEDGFESQFDNLSEPLTRGPAGARAPPYPPARDYTANSTRYRDPVFAVLFLGHLAVVAFFAAAKGTPALAAGGIPEVEIDKSGAQQPDEADQPVPLVLGLSLMMVLGAFFSSVWIKILITHGESLIRWTLLSTVVWFVLCSVAAAFARSVVGSIMLLISAGISYWYYRSIDSRIEFAGKLSEHCVHERTYYKLCIHVVRMCS
jgi:hypothetical protein